MNDRTCIVGFQRRCTVLQIGYTHTQCRVEKVTYIINVERREEAVLIGALNFDMNIGAEEKGKNVYPHAHMQQLMSFAFASLIMNDNNKVVMYVENIH